MTARRRLTRLEGAVTPKGAVLQWLAEAQLFASLPAYVTWLAGQPLAAAPLVRIPAVVDGAARQAMRGQPRDVVATAVRTDVREATFLVQLVIAVNRAAREASERQGLSLGLLYFQHRALALEGELRAATGDGVGDADLMERWAGWRSALAAAIADISVADEARRHLEERFLDDRSALFMDVEQDRESIRERAELMRDPSEEGCAPAGRRRRARAGAAVPDVDDALQAMRTDASARAALLADLARAATLDLLGDTAGAATISDRRLRASALEPGSGAGSPTR